MLKSSITQIKDTYGFNMNYDNVCTQFLGMVKTVELHYNQTSEDSLKQSIKLGLYTILRVLLSYSY